MLQIWGGSLCYRQAQSINVNKNKTKQNKKKLLGHIYIVLGQQ